MKISMGVFVLILKKIREYFSMKKKIKKDEEKLREAERVYTVPSEMEEIAEENNKWRDFWRDFPRRMRDA